MLTIIAALLLTAIFVMTGLKKIRGFEATANLIASKLPFLGADVLYKLATVLVIILELLAPLMIVYAAMTGNYYQQARIACFALVAFTLATTFIFYYPVTEENQLMFMLHLGLAGGLLALAQLFR